MIHLNGVAKSFGPQALFEELDWHLKRGQRVGLVGPNGAGKSTLVKIITGAVIPDFGTVRIARGVTVGYLPQEIAELAGKTVRQEAREGLESLLAMGAELAALEEQLAQAPPAKAEALIEAYGELQARFEARGGFSMEHQVEAVLGGLGFRPEQFDVDCKTLSGGWQMRVALARLLLMRPDVLLLDEPTNHLDLESVLWLEHFLQQYPGSLVLISHDRWFLNRVASHIAELGTGGLRLYTGDFDAYLEQAAAQRALLERQLKNQQRRTAQLERFIDRFRYKASKARQVQSRVKALEKLDRVELDERRRSVRIQLPEPPKSGRVVLSVQNVHKAYGEQVVYAGLDCELIRGRHIALVGANGAGKTTLLKLMAGVVQPDAGQVALGFQARHYYFAQHQVEVLDPRDTVLQSVTEVAGGLSPTAIRAALGAFLFGEDDVGKTIGVLSGGERNRVALCRMLLTPANLLLLDEPTNHLDMESRAVLEEALAEYAGTVVLISHDRQFIDGVCDEVWEVGGGRITPFIGGYTDYQARVARGERPEPLPLHAARKRPAAGGPTGGAAPRPGPQPQAAAPAAPAAPAALDWGGGDAGVRKRRNREDKRAEAERRQARSAATRMIKVAVEAAERRVGELEARLARLREIQADPAHYEDPEAVLKVAQDANRAEEALEAALGEWTQRAAELEAIEAEFEG